MSSTPVTLAVRSITGNKINVWEVPVLGGLLSLFRRRAKNGGPIGGRSQPPMFLWSHRYRYQCHRVVSRIVYNSTMTFAERMRALQRAP